MDHKSLRAHVDMHVLRSTSVDLCCFYRASSIHVINWLKLKFCSFIIYSFGLTFCINIWHHNFKNVLLYKIRHWLGFIDRNVRMVYYCENYGAECVSKLSHFCLGKKKWMGKPKFLYPNHLVSVTAGWKSFDIFRYLFPWLANDLDIIISYIGITLKVLTSIQKILVLVF